MGVSFCASFFFLILLRFCFLGLCFDVEQTGSGFIKAVREGGEGGYEIHVNAAETQPRGYKSNPATNDWVPNSEEYQVEGEKERGGSTKLKEVKGREVEL